MSILVAFDIATHATCLTIIPDSTTLSVITGLNIMATRFRFPEQIVVDAGKQLVSLASTHKDLMDTLALHDVTVIALPANHQFASAVERQIQSIKRVFSSMRESRLDSVYFQPQTLLELQGKLFKIEGILNARPILSYSRSQDLRVSSPKELLSPSMSQDQLQEWIIKTVAGVTSPPDLAPTLKKLQLSKDAHLNEVLLSHLQQEGLRFKVREGDGNKSDAHGLEAEIGDIVLVTINKCKHLAKVVGLDTDHQNIVQLKALYYGVPTVLNRHVRTLCLIYRPTEWKNGIPLPPASVPPDLHHGQDPQTPGHDPAPHAPPQLPGD